MMSNLETRQEVAGGPPAGRPASGLDSHPNYQIDFVPSGKRVKVVFNGVVVADSSRAMVMRETRHQPVYYLPREDIRMELLQRTAHHTHCPFKGNASYWTLTVGDKTTENAAWSYEEPFEEAAQVKDYLAFYWNKIDAWFEEDQELSIDTSDSAQGHANSFIDWILREAWEATTVEELVGRLARCLAENGVPLWRLSLIIRTLHPQLLGRAYVWQRDKDEIELRRLPHSSLESPAFLNSPLVPIFQGAGGIRRRLDVDNPQLDFPILEEFHAAGATDYVAMPMRFSDGQINCLTLTSDRPGGFSTSGLGQVYEILPVVSRLLEVHAIREMAASLLDTYLGTHSGQQVLSGQVKRGDGTDIPAVIWLCDLRDSTAMADRLPRDVYLGLLNEFFEGTAGAVLDQGGEVLKFIGDAVLAIFPIEANGGNGSNGDAEGACTRALDAARHAVSGIAALNRQRESQGEAPLRFSLAIHLGEFTYGNVGTPGRLDFTATGSAINETSRLAAMGKELDRQVLISSAFAKQLTEPLDSLGDHSLRGVEAKHEIFTLPETASDQPAVPATVRQDA